MKEVEMENLFLTFKQTIDSIIIDKQKNPKNEKMLNSFNAKINIGLHVENDFFLWVNLSAFEGNYGLNRGKLDQFDLEILATPEDLLFFSSGDNSILTMLKKKNEFGYRKLRYSKSSNGKRNLGKLLKLSKIIVLD
ncbi:MAG: hypothetical protein KGD65_14685 [Candidatus Lokiarchaeota archaeon]|nr:hypothetical protein [Candidatus Lokiarchaeota archaeon]